jgi:DNA-binding NarL/FixJ family response regulator
MRTRVIVADADPAIAQALCDVLNQTHDIEVLLCCSNGEEALAAVWTYSPDVVVMDLHLPRMSGLAVVRQLQHEKNSAKIVLTADEFTDANVVDAIRAGVSGLVLKSYSVKQLARCIRKVAAGGKWLNLRSAAYVLEAITRVEGSTVAADWLRAAESLRPN